MSAAKWEAGVRGATGKAGQPAGAEAGAVGFNHDATRWGWPGPVGVFSLGLTTDGLADTAGNVCEWCSNLLTDDLLAQGWTEHGQQAGNTPADPGDSTSERALRGGTYLDTAGNCRPAFRYHNSPVIHYDGVGVRFVRVWLPHSGHWTP